MSNRKNQENHHHLKLALDDARALATPAGRTQESRAVSTAWAIKAAHVGDLSVLALALCAA